VIRLRCPADTDSASPLTGPMAQPYSLRPYVFPSCRRKTVDLLRRQKLLAVERGWCDVKSSLGLRPVYHHREDRIRARVQLCWLALLLVRVAETATSDTWRNLRHELDRMHLVTLATTTDASPMVQAGLVATAMM
jgi:hypothetical protein